MMRLLVLTMILCVSTCAFAQRTKLVYSHGSDEVSLPYRLNISSGDSDFCYLFPYNTGLVDVNAQAMFFAPDVPLDSIGFRLRLKDSVTVYVVGSNTTELDYYTIVGEMHGPLPYGFYLTYCTENFRFYGLVEPLRVDNKVNVGRCFIGGAFYTPAPKNDVYRSVMMQETAEDYYDVLGHKVFAGTFRDAERALWNGSQHCFYTRHGNVFIR